MPPTRIADRYQLQEKLGEGAMGVVWRALDSRTGGPVAIKIMKDISGDVATKLLARELRVLASISHPNLIDVRDVDVIEESGAKRLFVVTPLLRGATLAQLIIEGSASLTLDRIVRITGQVCAGLQALHERGLVHGYLTPSNIFILPDDTAKIMDFGLIRLGGGQSLAGQT